MQDNFNKLKLEAESSKNGIEASLGELLKGLESLGKEIETMSVALKTTDDKISSLEKESQELNSELINLKQEHQNLSQDVESKEKELAKINEELQDKQHVKNTLEADISNKEKEMAELNREVNTIETEIADLKNKLVNAEELREEKVGTIEKEVKEYKDKIERKTNQYKVLRHFLVSGDESDPHFDVIKVLKQPGVSTIDQLVMSSGVGRATVEETINDLSNKGIVSLNGGKFSVEKDFSI